SWHSLAIDVHDRLWTWGKNHFGMLGTGDTISSSTPVLVPGLQNIAEIGGGCFQSIAIDKAKQIFTFGDNPSGQLGNGTNRRCLSPISINIIDSSPIPHFTSATINESKYQLKKIQQSFQNSALFFLLIASLILNFYFIFKTWKVQISLSRR
ncbi:MAG TPA: hypothetical protein PLD02_06075, partial [Saprospiraceae bacterium]|nr:hypothetical protein [Saprospiraceae bacterium]